MNGKVKIVNEDNSTSKWGINSTDYYEFAASQDEPYLSYFCNCFRILLPKAFNKNDYEKIISTCREVEIDYITHFGNQPGNITVAFCDKENAGTPYQIPIIDPFLIKPGFFEGLTDNLDPSMDNYFCAIWLHNTNSTK